MQLLKPFMCGALAACLLPGLVFADEAKSKTDEVIVNGDRINLPKLTDETATGSRLNITVLDTPATVQTISGDVIRLRGDTDIVTSVTRAAGITSSASTGSGGFGFAARGFGSASVTLLYDGIKSLINVGSGTYPYDTWNVERIEVLNGPASVLYGSGAIGAAVNVIPRKPSAVQENTIRLAAGSLDTYSAALDSTGPLTDKLLYRIDASRNTSDGYVQRGESHSTAYSGALKYEIADNLSVTLSGDYADRENIEYIGSPLIDGKAKESLRHINYSTYDGEVPFTDSRGQLLIEWQPSDVIHVRNVSSYVRGERLWKYASRFVYRPATNDILRSGYGTFTQHQDQIDNHSEVAWQHTLFDLENTLSFGADFVRLSNDRYVDNYAGSDIVDLRNSNPGKFPTTVSTRNYQDMNVDQRALFAEDRLQLTQDWSVIGGIRFDHSDVHRKDLVADTIVSKLYTPKSWRVGSVYQLTPQFNVYAQYATAVDPVGNLCCISAAQMAFALSEGKQAEVGLKQVTWDGKLEWSAAAYKITKNKLLTPDPNNLGLSLQVGQQSSRGLEAMIALTPLENWRVELNGTILKAQYDDFAEAVSGQLVSRDGNRPTNTPQKSANLWVTWGFAPQWQAQAGARYVGDIYANTDNTQKLPGFTVVDAGLHWDAALNIGIDVRAKNVFDKFYAYTTSSNGANGGQWVLGAPRTAEVALTAKF
ncbi:MAG: putative TonB-dependent siderophore receptor [Verrucomicrobiaceae bacterium]|nr:putative TonB-dependent siderophore receptor [Verrucomicrobiaceae bacterium]